jgi:hypothetical protein
MDVSDAYSMKKENKGSQMGHTKNNILKREIFVQLSSMLITQSKLLNVITLGQTETDNIN